MAHQPIPYPREDLYRVGPQRTFTGASLSEIAFPLGGIGTGTVSLGGRGNLRDFEIFGKPAKGQVLAFTFFALWARAEGGEPVARILEGQIPPPYRSGHGEPQWQLQGVARMREASFRGEYPTAMLKLCDREVPVQAALTAWNPFIPQDVAASALPAAIFEWTFTNPGRRPVEISLASCLSNPYTTEREGKRVTAGSLNRQVEIPDLHGVLLTHPEVPGGDPAAGAMSLTTTWPDTHLQTHWYRGGWWDRCHLFWDDFAADGRITPVTGAEPTPAVGDVCTLVLTATVPAGGSVTLPVLLTWHYPYIANPWRGAPDDDYPTLRTWMGAHFSGAEAVAEHVWANLEPLRAGTERWRRAIFDSTLPSAVLEAVTSQASIIRSPTCFLLADGDFFGWEGCHDHEGCCHGNCTHVWNYEQALAFLFPSLERSMRRTEFLRNTRPSGSMAFRTFLPPGNRLWEFKPCADGQMGTVIQAYRDWQLSGDEDFLREIWPNVRRALEYAWTMTPEALDPKVDSLWDPDRDGVMEGEQHNTYDIEFFGPNILCTGMYLGALRAGEEMARHLGEGDRADQYRALYESGRKRVEADLWNGEYYMQRVQVIPEVTVREDLRTPPEACGPECPCKQTPGGRKLALEAGEVVPKYQFGEGCLADQLLGQYAAHVAGLGYLLDATRVRQAVQAIFRHNFRRPIGSFSNVQRVYALNDEAGLLLCTWPRGNRPALPFPYCDEVWTGFEFQVAAHLVYEGCVDEGLAIVQAITDRYAGYNRNPWNHIECGHHYARAMASWAVKLALDGFSCSMPQGRLGFAPRLPGDFRTFWSTGTGWGTFTHDAAGCRLEVLGGSLTLKRLDLAALPAGEISATANGERVPCRREGDSVLLAEPMTLAAGGNLEVTGG